MKMKKILATLLATAVATTMAVSSISATTVDLNAEYPGDWQIGATIPKADLTALGDNAYVKVTLELETAGLLPQQYVYTLTDNTWAKLFETNPEAATSDSIPFRKNDGFIPVQKDDTSSSFVLAPEAIAALPDDGGLTFAQTSVWVKSATFEAVDGPEASIKIEADDVISAYSLGEYEVPAADAAPAEEATEAPAEDAAPEATEAPAAEETAPAATENTETGNAPIVGMVAVMALAGVAMVASKKK